MADSIAVFPPGFRVTDENGDLVPGAKITFFQAGTSTPRLVYSDAALTVSLGSTVTCDASGAPVAGGGSDVVIYTGTTAYKIQVTTAANVLVPGYDFDNIRGALDTSTFDLPATVLYSVTPLSASTVLGLLDLGKCFAADPTSGQITVTSPSALAAGNGKYIFVRHDGTQNAVVIVAPGAETISGPGDLAGQKSITLYQKGDSVLLISDGAGWRAQSVSGLPQARFFRVMARQTTPPISAVAGDSYLINGAPTGLWLTLGFAANDIVTANGNLSWVRSRPPTNSGWLIYIAAENIYFRHLSAGWQPELIPATKAEQMLGLTLQAAVTPARQQDHQSACKAWVALFGSTGGIYGSYNVSSVTRLSTGTYRVNFIVSFLNAQGYTANVTCATAGGAYVGFSSNKLPSNATITATTLGGAPVDAAIVDAIFYGDQ
jgi:Protein of unknown function (DUF2793)